MPDSPRRARLQFDEWPAAVYAIGDVHGCLDQLLALEAQIIADAGGFAGEKWIVTLGDYIDRGPASGAVLDHVASPPPSGFKRFALIGNHEQLLLDFLVEPLRHTEWLQWGGRETAESYGIAPDPQMRWRRDPRRYAEGLRPLIPERHLGQLRTLPVCLSLPGFFFVHAGIRPGVPLARQDDYDLMWIRAPFLKADPAANLTVVHGHTPVDAPEFAPGRVDIDTGCFYSGVLTALRVLPDGDLKILQAKGAPTTYRPAL